jgi:hypothetical protein
MDALGEKAIARIHENRPDLRDKTPAETIMILVAERTLCT